MSPNTPTPNDLRDVPDLRAIFREHGVPFTVQRCAIFNALRERQDHPSADAMFESVAPHVPGVSRTTVYRSLETFVDAGLATRVSHPGAVARYDAKTHTHHHLVCDDCGALVDIEPHEIERVPRARLRDRTIEVHSVSLLFRGRCADCASQ